MMRRDRGYILPATIMLGLGIAILGVTLMQLTSNTSQALNNQNYQALAKEAADAGIQYANSCAKSGTTDWANPLQPNIDCTGNNSQYAGNTNAQYLAKGGSGEWQSTFSVSQPTSSNNYQAVSTGTVQLLSGTTVVQTYTATKKTSFGHAQKTWPTSVGESLTDIKNDQTDCAIANGQLYCWGGGSSTPQLVGGALTGKTVTQFSVAYTSICAVADGQPYCWGDNTWGQLGGPSVSQPTAGTPSTTGSSDLAGHSVKEISTASINDPADAIWPFATAFPHTCALLDDGSVACWGDNGFRQQTNGGLCADVIACNLRWGFFVFPDHSTPTLIMGYGSNAVPSTTYCLPWPFGCTTADKYLAPTDPAPPFTGKKADHVGASSHDTCVDTSGIVYCMGVQAPLPIQCNTFGLFSHADETIVPGNLCIATFSNGYNIHDSNILGVYVSALHNKTVDTNLWNISADEGCWMANKTFICFGTTPAFDLFWLDSWGAPWAFSGNPFTDVTDIDNGDSPEFIGLIGLYCMINDGKAYCSGQIGNAYTGTNANGYKNFQQLVGTGSGNNDGLSRTDTTDNKIPTKIAAGDNHGCVIANGQLFCWGIGPGGQIADSQTHGIGNAVAYPKVTGCIVADCSKKIGTTDGTYAASGALAVGDKHSCGVVNGKLFCWGKNNYGQLGLDPAPSTTSQPSAVGGPLSNKVVTQVSAGANHTCAVATGQLYCWGDNSKGQLGLGAGSAASYNKPHLVTTLSNMRITDVSAGGNTTCVIGGNDKADGTGSDKATAYCWGDNTRGQLGNGTTNTTPNYSPVKLTIPDSSNGDDAVPTKISVSTNSTGASHVCLIANSEAYCWGDNTRGQLGYVGAASYTPKRVTAGTADQPRESPQNMTPSVSDITAGDTFTCAIMNSNVSCWGNNDSGQLGRGTTGGTAATLATPTVITGTAGNYYSTNVSAGSGYACALIDGGGSKTTGNTYCWGDNTYGQLGRGTTGGTAATLATPTPLSTTAVIGGVTNDNVYTNTNTGTAAIRTGTSITTGTSSACNVANGTIQCWGVGTDGQIGNGYSNTAVPLMAAKTLGYFLSSTISRGVVY